MEFKLTNSFSRENLNYEDGAVKNIHYGDIHTKFQTLFDITKENVPFINEEAPISRISEDFYCKEGDIVFADASEDLNDVGKSIELVNLNNEKLLSGLHTLLARPKENLFYRGFNGYQFKSNNVRIQIQREAQGSKVLSISAGRISKIKLTYPSLFEQKKITSLLALIDERISTQNKIIDHLETLIKGLKEKLFIQKIRFPDFNNKWARFQVSELLHFFSTNSLSWEQLEYGSNSLYNLHYGIIHQKLGNHLDLKTADLPYIKQEYMPKNYTLCQDGDIAFADASEDTNDVGKVIEFLNCDKKNIVCGLHTIHARDRLNLTVKGFKAYALSSKIFRNQIRKLAQGTKVFSISAKTFKGCFIDIPSKPEQQRIYNLLSLLSKKVESERLLLIRYERQKKYLLKNLFK